MSFAISVEFEGNGFQKVKEAFEKLADPPIDDLIETLAFTVENQTKARLQDEEKTPDGNPWPELSPKYAAWKAKHFPGAQKMLERKGDLRDSIVSLLNNGSAEIGSNLPYAARQHFGDDGGFPSREFLGISDDNMEELDSVADDWASDLLRQVQ